MITIFWAIQVAQYALLIHGVKEDLGTSNNTSSKVNDLIHLTSYFTQCFEHLLLLYGIYLYYTRKDGKGIRISTIMRVCTSRNHITLYIVVVVAVVILMSVSTLPVILVLVRPDYYSDVNSPNFEYAAFVVFAAMECLFNFFVRTAMAVVTVMVISAWKKAEKEINEENNAVKTLLDHLVEKYHSTGNKVNTMQKLFQGWFAIKWLVHFINITGYSLLAAGTMLSGNRDKDEYEEYQFNILYVPISLGYDVFAFSFLYVCGSLMNHYHTDYRKKQAILLRAKLSESNDEYALIMRTSDSIIGEGREYRFLPTIFWIDLPLLNSPSYILIMLLAVVGFTANFLV